MEFEFKIILILAFQVAALMYTAEVLAILIAFAFMFFIFLIVMFGDLYLLGFVLVFNMTTFALSASDIAGVATWMFFFCLVYYLFSISNLLTKDGNELLNLLVALILIYISNVTLDLYIQNTLSLAGITGGLAAATALFSHQKRFCRPVMPQYYYQSQVFPAY